MVLDMCTQAERQTFTQTVEARKQGVLRHYRASTTAVLKKRGVPRKMNRKKEGRGKEEKKKQKKKIGKK